MTKTVIMMIPKLSYSVLCSTAVALRFVVITGETSFNIACIVFEDVWGKQTCFTSAAGRSLVSLIPHILKTSRKNITIALNFLNLAKVQVSFLCREPSVLFSSFTFVCKPFLQSVLHSENESPRLSIGLVPLTPLVFNFHISLIFI